MTYNVFRGTLNLTQSNPIQTFSRQCKCPIRETILWWWWFNLTGTSLSTDTSAIKFLWKSAITLPGDVSQIVEKCLVSECLRILQKFLDPDTEADDFQNLTNSSLSIDRLRLW